MFAHQFEKKKYTLHKRFAYRLKEKKICFENLQEVSSLHLISKSYG